MKKIISTLMVMATIAFVACASAEKKSESPDNKPKKLFKFIFEEL